MMPTGLLGLRRVAGVSGAGVSIFYLPWLDERINTIDQD
jgi:hypothetical protein